MLLLVLLTFRNVYVYDIEQEKNALMQAFNNIYEPIFS